MTNFIVRPELGVCYYPEQWNKHLWVEDIEKMKALGLSWVRIGEFSWSELEPIPNECSWDWLDEIINLLGNAGLKIILCTPTATPPRWMITKYPDLLAVDKDGKARIFGSRRHYCFSHKGYQWESQRITALLAERYGKNKFIGAWQTDNEYGCHDTIISYSLSALKGFQNWLEQKYQKIEKLNEAWGNVFWSMKYMSFAEIQLPNSTVTEPNPAHVLDFRRYSSDQVVHFNLLQCKTIRKHSDLPILHNYMGKIIDFDHFEVGKDLEIASWDSYPLGFLEDRVNASEEEKKYYQRQGDPDFQALHHDLYRAVGHMRSENPRWWIMEQQPGPVNWAPFNPIPHKNMVRLWSWEAFAHGAEVVSYFRWRQAPFAQEQMHSGLQRPDREWATAKDEVENITNDLEKIREIEHTDAEIGLVFDYESCWAWQTQPQGQSFDYFELILDYYRALRKLGQSIDIIPAKFPEFKKRKVIIIPGLFCWNKDLLKEIKAFKGKIIIGPRSGSKTNHFSIPENLAPNIPGFDCKVHEVESLRAGELISLEDGSNFHSWHEVLHTSEEIIVKALDGTPAVIRKDNLIYIGGWLDQKGMMNLFSKILESTSIQAYTLENGHRIRKTAHHTFHFNYGLDNVAVMGHSLKTGDILVLDTKTNQRII
ncbi:beta-galactosidase [Portibacter marinus]|uniref:beta-galactosidase n=1 Tax=Portibacter marinus TaxID=2898660 RepID=UPI001F1907A3|nr:beta-galactosidase [Portibacter marinus]